MVNQNIMNICRICLTENEKNESMYECAKASSYNDMIKEFIGLDMVQQDNLPYTICNVCSAELIIVVNFITKCRSSNFKLQEALEHNVPFEKFLAMSLKEEDMPLSFLCAKKEDINETDVKDEMLLTTDIKEENTGADNFFDTLDSYDEGDINTITKTIKKVKTKGDKRKCKRVKRNPLECKICGEVCASADLLKKHKEDHRGERSFVCPHCGRGFTMKCTLREHIGRVHMRSLHMSKMSCVCDLCGKVCYRKNDLNIHMRTHTKEKPYRCTMCGESFSQGSTLSHHMRRHTGERPFSCHVCGKGFVSQSGLKTHMSVHSAEKNYKCQVCDKALKSSKGLKQHLLLHSSHKPNVCEICGAAFAQKVNLKTHKIAKHSERSGTCEVCKKAFSDLSEHMRIHTGEKPFNCDVCGRGFPRQRHLTTHLRRHREATKFACTHDKCNAAFPMQCQLDFHVLKFHTKYFPFICEGCNKGFYRLADLNKHINASNCKKNGQHNEIPVKMP